jgi:hypothetical protein
MAAQTPGTTQELFSGRFIIWSGYAVVATYLLGGVSLQVAAAIGTGDYAGLADPQLERYGDPKDWNPPLGPDSMWNPLVWVIEICRVAVMTGMVVLFGFASAATGLAQLVRHGASLSRGRFAALLVSTVLAASVAVVNLTPYGAQLRHWLLD